MVTRSRFSGRKRENISQRRDIDSDPRSGIGKNRLVENNITGDVDTSRGTIKTLVSLMHRTIAQENTHGGSESKLVCIIFAQTRPAGAPKSAKKLIIGVHLKETIYGCILLKNRCRHAINEIACRKECLIPKTQWERRMSQQSKACFNKMTVFAFSNAVLLRRVRARHTMRDASALEITMQPVILTTPVGLNSYDFSVEKTLNMSLKGIKYLLNVRLVLKEINPREARVIVNKAHIIFITSGRSNSWPPNIRMN